jgi:hypothetical protein
MPILDMVATGAFKLYMLDKSLSKNFYVAINRYPVNWKRDSHGDSDFNREAS